MALKAFNFQTFKNFQVKIFKIWTVKMLLAIYSFVTIYYDHLIKLTKFKYNLIFLTFT